MTPRRVGPGYAHWPEVLRLIQDEFAYMEGRIDPPSSMHRLTVADMAESARTGAVFVVEDGGAPVACVFCKVEGDALYLGKLAVARAVRGRGLARALLAAAEAKARARGLTALELQTRLELTENHAAFARLGFVRTGETAHDGYDRPTSITMRKALQRSHPARETPTLPDDPSGDRNDRQARPAQRPRPPRHEDGQEEGGARQDHGHQDR